MTIGTFRTAVPRGANRLIRAIVTVPLLFVFSADARAQTPSRCGRAVLTLSEASALLQVDEAELARLADAEKVPGRRVGTEWRFNCEALLAWLAGANQLTNLEPAATKDPAADAQKPPIGEAPEEREAEEVLLRGQRVLLGRGEVVVDLAQFYSRSADHVLAQVSGSLALATVEQDTLSTLLLGRVGVFDETELFGGTLFQRQEIRYSFGATTLASSHRSAFAGVQLGIRRTLLREGSRRPDIIAAVSVQAPTDDARPVAGAGLVLVKSVDPVVLFAATTYSRTLGRGRPTSPQPQERVDVSMGYGLALNDSLAISMAVSGVFTGSVILDDAMLRQPGRYSARFGLTSWLAKGLYIEPSISFGLAGPGESFAFGISLPYAF